jgi:hypothetical protein
MKAITTKDRRTKNHQQRKVRGRSRVESPRREGDKKGLRWKRRKEMSFKGRPKARE